MIIRARAPLRLGLAGGGSDVSPFPERYGGYVLNATIDRFAYATLTPLSGGKVSFVATDRQQEEKLEAVSILPLEGPLPLHRAAYNHIVRKYNDGSPLPVELRTFCEVAPGSGLGSSSALVVVMLRAFCEYLNLPLDDYALAKAAFNIERKDCKMAGGKQDQYAAAFGGVNFIEFYAEDRTIVNPLRIKNWILTELESQLLLYFTGVSRDSSRIIEAQRDNVRSNNDVALEAMQNIKKEALLMKEYLLQGNFLGIVNAFRQGWENKKRTSQYISSKSIESCYEAAMEAGALAGKISGAGGGGFMMFIVPPENRMDVIRALHPFGGAVSSCHFTKQGAQSWTV